MDGIVRTRTIAFTPDRTPMLRRIRLGYEGDNLVERLEFDLPEITAGQTATLMITGVADAVKLDRTDEGRYAVDLTRDMIGPDGEREAYVRIDGAGEKVWQSTPMRLITGALPDAEEEIEKVYPTAVGQMLTAMAEHSSEMEAQEERVEQAAQRAEKAAERAEEAAERAEAGGSGGGGSGGSMVEIDATLTVQGAAADAKATGEAVSKLYEEKADKVDIPEPYTLPVATADTLGGVKVGNGLWMDGDVLGVVPDGEYELIETITIDTDTTIVSRTQTPSGEDYCYKDVMVNIAYISEHEQSMWARIKIWFDNNATLDAFRTNNVGTSTGEQVMQTYRYRNYVALRISGITTNGGYIVPENSVTISNAFVYNSGNIKRIDIDRQDGFFSGDILRIYAVKE